MQGFADWASRNTGTIKALALVLVGLVATLGTLSLIIKAVTIAITTFNAVVKIATVLQAAFNLVLALNPIGLVVIAIAAFVAGIVLAYKKIEPFRDLIDSIVQKIKDLGSAIKNSTFGKAIGGIFNKVTEGRAVGGTVSAGQAVRVGELGSEVFVPTTGGQIIPNNKLSGGGGNTFIFNGIVDAESARRSIERVMQNSTLRTGAVNLAGSPL